MKNLFSYLFCLFFLIFLNCKYKKSLEYLEFYYMGPNISTPYGYSCSMISEEKLKESINYKKIVDKKSFNMFMKLYNQYETTNDSVGMNIRIKVLIHNDSKIDTLCLGEHFNTYKNGVKMKDNEELLKYIKEILDYENTIPSFVKKHPERYGNSTN